MYTVENPINKALEGLDQAASTYASMDQNIPAQQDPGPTIGGAIRSGISGARTGYTALDKLGTVPAAVGATEVVAPTAMQAANAALLAPGAGTAEVLAASTAASQTVGAAGTAAAGTAAAGTAAAGTAAAGTAAAGTAASGASAAAPALLGMGPAGWLIGGAALGIGAYLLS